MRLVGRLLGALAALIIVALAGAYLWLRGSLPDYDGRISVDGLSASIEIIRDRDSVPHIVAQTPDDAVFGLGFVHAQDRLWQMEMNRRIGAGRLSEIVGPAGLGPDRFLRTLGVYDAAERTVAKLDAETRRGLDAYAAGVNAFLTTRAGPLPPEFLILGHEPEPWRPADSLVWVKMMAWDLAGNWSEELLRARLATKLSADQIAELFPGYPADGITVLEHYAALYDQLPIRELAAAIRPSEPHNGSNNWVVSGSRTESGKPLLANDPHLSLSAPALWYFAHLQAPDLDVIGATLPGVPAVVLGRNDRIAWGFTTTGSDVQDLFIERIDPTDSRRYLTPGGSEAFGTRKETIRVKGAAAVELDVRITRHGPVISDVVGSAAQTAGPGHVIAFAWPTLEDDDMTARAGLMINRARNWDEFLAAMRHFHSPQQNIVYADVEGNIGFIAPAKVPIRRTGHSGNEPVPGWTGAYDWTGFIPFEHLPQSFNPKGGVIATANNRIVPDDYPYYLTYDWSAPFRADRIAEMLDASNKHSIASFRAIQADQRSGAAAMFLPRLLRAPLSGATKEARDAHDRLARWNFEMSRDRPEPLIYVAWYRELTRMVIADELGEFLGDYWGLRPLFMQTVLFGPAERWCDDRTTTAREDCDALIVRALEHAIADLRRRHGGDMAAWRWGAAHAALSEHRPFHNHGLLARLFDIEVENGGDSFTVNAASHRIGDPAHPFRQHHGASFRAIYDLGEPDRSLFMHSSGQSGNVLSPRYRDFAARWRDVAFIPMQTGARAFRPGASGTLRLEPTRR
jgi:penicillin amidase